MNREEELTVSHDPFAIDLEQFTSEPQESLSWTAEVSAVWFRRKKGVLQACAGTLHGWFGEGHSGGQVPLNAAGFARLADRNGTWTSARCMARWDGTSFWAAPPMHPVAQRAYLELLEPMLAEFPAVPHGYDGWWRF